MLWWKAVLCNDLLIYTTDFEAFLCTAHRVLLINGIHIFVAQGLLCPAAG